MPDSSRNFRNLNRGGLWPDFEWDGLELDPDGTLRLTSLPLLEPMFDGKGLPAPAGPAGIAVDRDGTVFYTVPDGDLIYRVEPCFGGITSTRVEGDAGDSIRITGLLIPQHRRALYAADPEHHRILILDPDTLAALAELGGFQAPTAIASDADGNLYVVDSGARRVEKLSISGDRIPSSWSPVTHPGAIAASGDSVFILDLDAGSVFEFDRDGHLRGLAAGQLDDPMGLAADARALYIGENGRRRVRTCKRNKAGKFMFAGDAVGYEGPVAGLTLRGPGRMLVHAGTASPPQTLRLDSAYRAEGVLWSAALQADLLKHTWNRVHATAGLPANSHVQFFVHTSDTPDPLPVKPGDANPFAAPWRPVAANVTDFFVGGGPARYFFIGAYLSADRVSSPVLSQLRVDFDQEGFLRNLPAIYRTDSACGDFLPRFLALFESFYQEVEGDIAGLAGLFDPYAVPEEFLPWLAGFLALELAEGLSEKQKRDAVAQAFSRYSRRGTVSGLTEALRISAGIRAVIDEPIQHAGFWSMPAIPPGCGGGGGVPEWQNAAGSVLGFTTVLAVAEPQGAIAGTTARLDRSHLITEEEFGSPLFEDTAHQFTVLVYRGEVEGDRKLAEVREILDREKPAHTAYQLCVIGPGMRIGLQSRLGIDTVVAGGAPPAPLGTGSLVLAGEPAGRIGTRSRVGVSTRL